MSARSRWLRQMDRQSYGPVPEGYYQWSSWGEFWRSLWPTPRAWRKWRAVHRFPIGGSK